MPGGSAGTSFCSGTEMSISFRAMAFPRFFEICDTVGSGGVCLSSAPDDARRSSFPAFHPNDIVRRYLRLLPLVLECWRLLAVMNESNANFHPCACDRGDA